MKAKSSTRRTSARAKARSFSTSHARANFAEKLDTTGRDKTIVIFDRYRKPIAALMPLDVLYMLAGQDGEVTVAVREKIVRAARLLVAALPKAAIPAPAKTAAPAKAPRKKPGGKKVKRASRRRAM